MAAEAHLDHNVSIGPAWGTLALDVFMIENWSPRSGSYVSDDEHRVALARKYLQIGSLGRKKYLEAAGTVEPTEAQIETILRPFRSIALRSVAQHLTGRDPSPLWLRTDYGNDQRHTQFCLLNLDCVDSGDGLREDSCVLSDERYYNVESWQEVFDFLPEIVIYNNHEEDVTESSYRGGDYRRECEREYMDHEGEYTLCCQQYCCVARFLVVEDKEMYAFNPPRFHALWLDDCGDVVRESRITAEDACDFPPMANEGAGDEQQIWEEASIGPKYVHGAEHGAPFMEGSGNALAQDLQPLHT